MKKAILFLAVAIATLTSCKKEEMINPVTEPVKVTDSITHIFDTVSVGTEPAVSMRDSVWISNIRTNSHLVPTTVGVDSNGNFTPSLNCYYFEIQLTVNSNHEIRISTGQSELKLVYPFGSTSDIVYRSSFGYGNAIETDSEIMLKGQQTIILSGTIHRMAGLPESEAYLELPVFDYFVRNTNGLYIGKSVNINIQTDHIKF